MKENFNLIHSRFRGGFRPLLTALLPLILLAVLHGPARAAGADPGSVRVAVSGRSHTVASLIEQIENKSSFTFVFDRQKVDLSRKVDVTAGEQSVAGLLKAAFGGSDIVVETQGDYILLTPKAMFPATPKTLKQISGRVVNDNGEPIIGVTVVLSGTSRGTTTDAQGAFTLALSPGAKLLDVSYVGMKRKLVRVDPNGGKMTIPMQEDFTKMEEVVVIGYGQQQKRDITGAITSISAEDIENNVGGNINTALQGKIPGMSIISNSGEPGAGMTISIRGAASMSGGSEPLYIVDGVPLESENISSIEGDASFSPIAGINPSDIESIEVLKDAASAAIYGSRAANGVVIITTKGGNKLQPSKPVVSVSHTSSLVSVSRHLDVMNSEQFRTAYVEARANNGQETTNAWVTNPMHPYYMQTTDWQDVIFRTAYQTKNDFNVRGSTNNFSYSVSLGYKDVKPVLEGTSYQQYNARANFTYRITKHISAGTKASFSSIDYDRILTDNGNYYSALRAALFTNPCFSPYDPITGEMVDWLGQRESRNPLALAKKFPINFKRKQIILNQYVNFSIIKGLDFKISVSGDFSNYKQKSFLSKDFDSNQTVAARKDTGKYLQSEANNFLNENTLTYTKKFRGHTLSAVLGQSLQINHGESIYLNGENYVDASITEIQNASKFTKISRDIAERSMLSFFGRINYNYKSRYLASFTLRRDGSSRFGPDRRFGNFPSASVGWRFSDEKFMKFAKPVLDDAKLRASIGTTGNQNIGNYTWMGQYSSNSKKYNGNVAIIQDALPNNRLGWETTTQYNVGLDLSFFNGRLTVTADAYIKKSKDLLFSFPLSSYTGFGSVSSNFGSIENRGLEFLVNSVNFTGKFKWQTTFNISFNRNKITELPYGRDVIVGSYSLARVGQPAGVFYAHKTLGVYSRTEDNVWTDPVTGATRPVLKGSAEGTAFKGGDMIWDDVDGNGIIDDNDRQIIGSPHPKFIGGFGNTFSYKNFTLNVFLQFTYGNKIMNDLRRVRNQMTLTNNLGTDALRRWRKEGDVTDFPMIRYGDIMENFRASNFHMEDGSFVRLKDITLSYKVPAKALKKCFIKGLTVYVSGTNLLTWSKYSGYDPEVNSGLNPFILGIDKGAFPKSRSYNFGVDLTF